ncbi:Ppx/GppA family phosphatase [Streptomyces sp. XM4193]|uniref:Ppx/GppA phosphatase family protein n=1 Tax=Streptomyces sp. XM4193 TaxID=2929782 RepID=UPI001FFA7D57|nr:Ppx/GppA phosphatase family protein [Streptomyces sp. XM4193]MCK1796918.1 Ppx/GppA family phosphatase [Streptomyces sp. XM4193]
MSAPAPVRVAAIDCGTNSIRLLVADTDPATGQLTELARRMEIVRLGQGVDRTGRLAPEALDRTFAACRRYAEEIRRLGATHVKFVATSASRDAENRADFVHGVQDILGVLPEVISGDQEAAYSFSGATRELTGAELPTPYLVVDIGGGSTELVVGEREVRAARSVDIGCVRLTERHLLNDGEVSDPPTAEQAAAIRADAHAALDEAERTVPLTGTRTLVGLAGTVTTLAAMHLDLAEYDSAAIHHSRLPLTAVRELAARLLASTHAERAAIPAMHPGRVDVIASGAVILQAVMERCGAPEVVVSEHDILDGIAIHTALDAQ